ncbi:S8 family serine peptidase [Halobacillus sp. ACCC02827]|uniref:S8 family serine peptidase n=1 Tax=Halobacillus sp. ACCC02827 TaxID=3052090 RepID=UPI00256FD48F|nr:S8 family serine peptidase [Halobacillus sp. ACCC02827]WJE14999.1 S8 family serine peptidase [Halobacillus sp. ACCC02827]
MKSRKLWAILIVLAAVCFGSSHVMAEEDASVKLIVKYKDRVTTQSTDPVFPLDVVETDKRNWKEKKEDLEQDPDVDYVELDAKVYSQGAPNDTFYPDQQVTFQRMNVIKAWDRYKDASDADPVVAVVDSGVNASHPDLKGQVIKGTNLLESGQNPTDHYGHGTHVAGLIGAVTNNKTGVASLSKGDVRIMPVKMMEENEGSVSDLIDGIEYAVDHDADIINLSLGTYTYRSSLEEAVQYAVEHGVLVVAAAGNDEKNDTLYPAAFDQVVAVGSYDLNKKEKASFSNYGADIDVVTPGTDLISTYLQDDYEYMEGTSMSTGHVSSLAAMVKNQAPFLTGQQTKRLIEQSASPVAGAYELGNGMIDAEKTLAQIKESHRISGATAVDTAVEISKQGWNELQQQSLMVDGRKQEGKFVILATAKDFPDSLAVSPLASYLNSPVLLEKKDRLSSSVAKELKRLGATDVIMVGGTAAVHPDVEKDLKEAGYRVHRIKGADRYETAIAVNELIPYDTNKAFVVSGQEFPDALSAAGYSGMKQYPIIYVKQNKIPESARSYLEDLGITKAYIVGGTNPVSNDVEKELEALSPYRISGATRYETNEAMHRTFGNKQADTLYFTTGRNFPDAMAVTPLAVQSNSPVLLTNQNKWTTMERSMKLFGERADYHIIGGSEAISIPLAWKIDRVLIN